MFRSRNHSIGERSRLVFGRGSGHAREQCAARDCLRRAKACRAGPRRAAVVWFERQPHGRERGRAGRTAGKIGENRGSHRCPGAHRQRPHAFYTGQHAGLGADRIGWGRAGKARGFGHHIARYAGLVLAAAEKRARLQSNADALTASSALSRLQFQLLRGAHRTPQGDSAPRLVGWQGLGAWRSKYIPILITYFIKIE